MVVLSEKYAVKLFEKGLSSTLFAVCPCSCSRILMQSMAQAIKKNFFYYLLVLQTTFLEFAFCNWCEKWEKVVLREKCDTGL